MQKSIRKEEKHNAGQYDCLLINGPDTGYKDKIVIFAGGAASDSYKKIRGNSYGMWIATEINLHHDNTIKEAFNRQLAAKNRKIFWDLNPDHPKAAIYVDYIDKYAEKAAKGELLGGYNYEHFNIFENINIPKQRIAEIVSQYDKDSIWYIRDIEGKRSIAEGLIYVKLATSIAAEDDEYIVPLEETIDMAKRGEFIELNIGVDFGGNGSGHAIVASGITQGYEKLYTGVTASASGTVNVRNYLQKGDSGDAVKEMQKMLIGCGFSCGSSGVDGSFGGDTEKALLAFQAFYGLEQDGKYGPVSKSKLVSAYNGKTAASVPEKKNTPSYTAGHEYTLQVELKVRTGPGTNYSAKKHSQLTADGQKHDRDNDGCLDAGTVVTCQEVRNVGNDIWMKAPSGWMAAYYDGKVYIK